ncbi:hypothetical protein TrVE_jg10153 [Triparma verrucosa]|uniref:Uncharacterized protein n=1 Tax=Triparma verrucosa TaxID=1606542 RepID=A0A9W7EPG3_9STRA|nr:hypothetical protein TrVE_jg10153 [Triparma verrucosa]
MSSRHLFVGESHTSIESVIFLTLSCVLLLLTLRLLHLTTTLQHYSESSILKYAFPTCTLLMSLDNLVMYLSDSISSDHWIGVTAFVVHPFVTPVLLMTTFEITYLVHKRRSVNLLGIKFDEGRRVKTGWKSWVLRNLVGVGGLGLAGVGVVVNFDLVQNKHVDPEAGNVSWMSVFDEGDLEMQVHKILGLLPTLILVLSNLYFAVVMWRYGSNSSMIIHSSYLNPWICMFLGTLVLASGQFPRSHFKTTSNAGEAFLVLSIMFLMNEVDRDMSAASEFTDFLEAIEDKTNSRDENRQIKASIRGVPKPKEVNKTRFWGFGGGGGQPENKNGLGAAMVQLNDVEVRL